MKERLQLEGGNGFGFAGGGMSPALHRLVPHLGEVAEGGEWIISFGHLLLKGNVSIECGHGEGDSSIGLGLRKILVLWWRLVLRADVDRRFNHLIKLRLQLLVSTLQEEDCLLHLVG